MNKTTFKQVMIAFLLCAIVGAGNLLAQVAQTQAASDTEMALRKRVTEFYSYLRAKRVADAEKYVTADSLEQFRLMPNGEFIEAEVSSIQFAADKKSAEVLINLRVSSATIPVPFALPRKTNWRQESDGWRIVIPSQTSIPAGANGMFPDGSGMSRGSAPKPELSFRNNSLVDLNPIKQGEKKVVKAEFTNSSDHAVTITGIKSDCTCIVMKSEKKTYKPGESGEIVIEFDSKDYQYNYGTSVAVIIEPPAKQTITFMITGRIAPKY